MNSECRAWVVCRVWLVVALVGLFPSLARAQDPSPEVAAMSEAYDRELLREVEHYEPSIDGRWLEASEAREARDDERAIELYTAILVDHPQFDHALRRRCGSHASQERYAEALDDCTAAYELAPSQPENALSLALVLAAAPAPIGDLRRAKVLAKQVMKDGSEDFVLVQGVCAIAGMVDDRELFARCANTMEILAPRTWEAQLMMCMKHGMSGNLDLARRALDKAHTYGLDDATYQMIAADLEPPPNPGLVWAKRVGVFLGAWVGLALFLTGAGFALSRLTLAEAESVVSRAGASARASDSGLHKAYAAVLWMCCAYYYISVPLILLTIVALGLGVVGLVFYIGFISIKLIVILFVVVGGTVVAVVKSFFTRPATSSPGEALDLAEAPGLREVLDEVAAKVQTRPVDTVYLSPGADIAVFERGGLLAKLRGKGERCLVLGVAAVDGLDTHALRAILAHEYGHFSNQDTAGGNFALNVRRSVMRSVVGLAQAGAAGWFNPAWVFLLGFHRVFLRISQGASRLQEVLADRWAARSYGADSFERGLRHVIEAELRFDVHANATLHEVLEQRRGLRNLYTYEPSETPEAAQTDIAAKIEEAIHAEPSPYDSHPRPADRFRWVRALVAGGGGEPSAELVPSWSLFGDPGAIQERMTAAVCATVAEQTGQVIPADENERVRRQRRLSADDLVG